MKILVWTIPTRLIHWLLVMLIGVAFFSGDIQSLRSWHALAGLLAGVLWLFRMVWGIWGPRYSRFSDFRFRVTTSSSQNDRASLKPEPYAGHLLEASWVMALIYLTLLIVVVSGFLALPANSVPALKPIVAAATSEAAGLVHSAALSVLWILILVHLTGVILSIFNEPKTGIFQSIFTGYKNMEGESARLTSWQKGMARAWFAAFVVLMLAGILMLLYAK